MFIYTFFSARSFVIQINRFRFDYSLEETIFSARYRPTRPIPHSIPKTSFNRKKAQPARDDTQNSTILTTSNSESISILVSHKLFSRSIWIHKIAAKKQQQRWL